MTREEFRAKWSARRAEWEKLGVLVSGAKMCEEFITDFENVLTSHDEAVLNTNQAAAMTGYSRAQLLHLYKQGKLRGHKNGKHVFFRAGDLPRKPRGGRPVIGQQVAPAASEETRANAGRLAARLGIKPGARRQVPI
jgi:predicted DNA-binding transcriptional regulator AlpA